VLNVVALVTICALVVWLSTSQGCHTVPSRPNDAESAAEVDLEHVLRQINGLNVMSNLLIAVPGIILLIMGLPLEGGLVMVCAFFSTLWHATGWRSFAIVDKIFAILTLCSMVLVFLRICQVRGYPELSAFYLILPAACALMYLGGDAACIANDGSLRPANAQTLFLTGRISHAIWHVLVGAVFMVLVIELLRTPDLIPNRLLANTVRARDAQMHLRTWRMRGMLGKGPNPTIIGGLVVDLFSKSRRSVPHNPARGRIPANNNTK
jgi:hypothetical protein